MQGGIRLDVANSEMAAFDDLRVLVIERFDRRLASTRDWWIRLPQEDLWQATATPPGNKYEADGGAGVIDTMHLLLGAQDAHAQRRTFFKTQALFWMLAAIDGHAKNFSVFLERGGAYRLTPLYDLLSAYPVMGSGAAQLAPQKARMAMALSGGNRHSHWASMLSRHWFNTARASGFASDAERMLAELVERAPAAIEEVNRTLPRDFAPSVADSILEGVSRAATRLAK